MKFTSIVSAALLASLSIAHPGQSAEEHAKEVLERRDYLSTHKRSLAHCADQLEARGHNAVMQQRRNAKLEDLRAKRSIAQEKAILRARDLDTVLNTTHASNLTGITVDTDPSILFAGNNSCILTPETTEGPYWVEGEVVRSDVTEDQEGIPLHLDIQLIDVNTCDPVPQAYLEIWHCNATGVYAGVINSGNGNSDDLTNIDNTFLRGIQASDDSGVVQFDTIFPGHYTGRTTHIHVLTHNGATLLANNTLSGGNLTHVGQIFADQDLISLVEATSPYNTNTQELTTNAEDSILAGEAADVDPMIEYVLVGDDIEQGLFGWIAFGFDNTASYNVTPAVYWTSDGGVKNPDGMGGGPPPSGSAPGVIASTLSTVGSSASAPA